MDRMLPSCRSPYIFNLRDAVDDEELSAGEEVVELSAGEEAVELFGVESLWPPVVSVDPVMVESGVEAGVVSVVLG